jgi:type IV secretory pathway VirJ component
VRLRRAALLALAVAGAYARGSRAQGAPGVALASLPTVEVPAAEGHTLALLLSGDGGWAAGDRAMAEGLARGGVAVVGLDSRAYLRTRRATADGLARDAASLLERYGARWHRDRFVLLGYSRGADLAPFVVNRWPDSLRRRLVLVALVGLAARASFEFHWEDLVRDAQRASDLPVQPELERLRGVALLCLFGDGERGSLCPALDRTLARVDRHPGHHEITAHTGGAVANRVLRELGPAS